MSEKTTVPAKPEGTKPRRWDPFDLLTQMQTELDQFWGGRRPMFRPFRRLAELPGTWAPSTDVYERNGNLVVKAELPGVKKDDIDVAIEDGDLVIRGERNSEEKVEEKDYYRMERSFGSFYRRLPLPEGATADQIDASFADGVLEVTMPKPATKEPTPTKVPIK